MRLYNDVINRINMKIIFSLILAGSLAFGIAFTNETPSSNLLAEKTKEKKEIPAPSNCPASPFELSVDQADGTRITILGKGNINNPWTETTDGFSIVDVNGVYEYAKKVNGELVGTGVKANDSQNRTSSEINFVSSLQSSLKPDFNPLKSSILSQVNAQLSNKTYPTTGNVKVLTMLIDYPDLNNTYPKSNFDSLLYGANYRSGDGSFKTFYETASNGVITVDVDVVGWYRAANNYTYYSRDSGYDRAADLVREAVDAAENAGVNFAQYDNDNDGDVDGVLVVHAGPGAESGSQTQFIWSHRWVMNGGNLGSVTYDGKFINDYMMNPETRGSLTNPRMVGIGVFCHEFGHNLGLPDLYDTDPANGDSEGIGNWCLMAGGGWLGGEHRPVNFSAWCRIENNWDSPTVMPIGGSSSHSLSAASTTQNEIIQVNTAVSSEYFLLENRQQTGLDLELPGTGLAIWHINTTKTGGNGVNADANLKGVDLEEADGNNDLDNSVNRGDAGDLFPGTSNNSTFDDNSIPNARTYNLATTGFELRNIAEVGNQLNFDFGPFVAATCSGGTTTITSATGTVNDGSPSGSNYSNNLNCSWLIQPTNATSVSLNFSRFDVDNTIDRVAIYDGVDFSAPLIGTYTGTSIPSNIVSTGGSMYIEFTTNGSGAGLGWSADFTSSTTSAGCSGGTTTLTASAGNFSDGSGASNYANNLNCSWLIQPPGVSSITIGFSALATEVGTDLIRIYDGTNNTAPLIASYSGTNNLNTTTSSGGSMFVEFVTNASVTDAGFDAVYTSSTAGAGCSGATTLTATSGSFSDGSGANNYDNNQFCSWLIQPGSGTISLNFSSFSTEVNNDRVLVFDGVDNTATQIGNFSGSSIPPALTSSGSSMYVEFRTDGFNVDAGWDASYTTNVSSTTCSGTTNITNTAGTIDDGSGVNSNYSDNLDCNWLINITTANIIQITFDSMDVAAGDTVFIYDGNSTSAPLLGEYSGSSIPPIVPTTGNTAFINFKSNTLTNDKGWQISYAGVNGCAGRTTFTATAGTFSDGTTPTQQYVDNSNCEWLIQPPGANFITLDFNRFNTEANFDFVEVFDGATTGSPSLGRFDGNSIPASIISSGGSLLVLFTSDGLITELGWEARYNSTTSTCLQNKLLTATSGNISDGSGTNNYDNNLNCSWLIQPTLATSITLTFNSFNTQASNDVINVYDGADNTGTLIGSYSGNTIPTIINVTGTNKALFVEFITDGIVTAAGWDASYTAITSITCSGVTNLTTPSGSFSDGSGTGNYDNNLSCGWLIQPSGSPAAITFTLSSISLADFGDRVRVYDGINNTGTPIGFYSGSNIGNPAIAYSGSMYVEFTTNGFGQGAGWNASYTSSSTYCSPTTTFTADFGNFSDGSPTGSNYLDNTDCQWLIQPTTPNVAVRLNLFQFSTEAANDTVTVYDGATTSSPILGTYSGTPGNFITVTSSGGSMLLTFKSNGSVTSTGWRANYSTQPIPACAGLTALNGVSGTFDDGSAATAQYVENSNCQWLIQPTGASIVSLSFNRFETQATFDFVRVYDGPNNSSPLLGTYSGTSIPPTINSSGNSMFLEFVSNGFQNFNGWEATYTSSTSQCFPNVTLTNPTDTIEDGSQSLNYQNNLGCNWLIQPPTATSITLDFLNFDVDNLGDTLKAYDGANASAPLLGTYTGATLPTAITSTGGSMFLEFNTDGSLVAQGWRAVYTITSSLSCIGTTTLTAPSGSIADGSGFSNYDNNLNCGWLIQPPGNPAVITYTMNNLNLANFGDRVSVYDGVDNTGQLLRRFFGTNTGQPVSAFSGSMFIEFTTDASQQGQGWDGTYNSSNTFCTPSTVFTANFGNFTDGSPFGQNYLDNTDCEWLIQPTTPNVAVRLTLFQFDTENGTDTVTIYDGATTSAPILATYSGNLGTLTPIVSSGGDMLVTFKTNGSGTATGWRANYSTQQIPACSGLTPLTAPTGTFDDGSGNGNTYVANSNCQWLIQPPGAISVDLSFNYFNTQANFDVVNVYDGVNNSAPSLGTFSGNNLPGSVTASSGTMFVEFITNASFNSNGFEANYTSSTSVNLVASPDTVFINAGAGSTGSYNVSSNTSWQTSDNAVWLLGSPFNGSGNQSVNLIAIQPNIGPERMAMAFVDATTSSLRDTVIVIQRASGNFLSVNPDTLFFSDNPTASQLATISSSVSWTATPNLVWITAATSSGSNNGSSAISASQNTGTTERVGFVVFAGNLGVADDTVFVKQAARVIQPPSLSVTPRFITLANTGSSDVFTVNSTVQWQTSTPAGWITITNPTFTQDTNTVLIAANTPNLLQTTRTSFVAVQDVGGTLFDTVFVSQVGSPATLAINPDTLILNAANGSVNTAILITNVNWIASSGASWFSANPLSGSATTTSVPLTITANSSNTNVIDRISYLAFDGGSSSLVDTLVVIQRGTPVAPSNLSASPKFISLDRLANSLDSFTVNSNVTWQVSSPATWLTVNAPASTMDTNKVEIVANSANASPTIRSTYVAIQDVGATLFDTVLVDQLGTLPDLTANPDTVRLAGLSGSTGTGNITSNLTWSVTSGATWFSVNNTSGSNNSSLTFTAQSDNQSGAERISFAAVQNTTGSLTDTIVIVQDFIPSTGGVTTNPDTIRIQSAVGSSNTFMVNAGVVTSWTSNPNDNWINLSSTSGTGTQMITVTANTANTSASERMTFIVTSDVSLPIPDTVFVIQEGAQFNLGVNPNAINLNFASGSNDVVTVSSNVNWTVNNPVTWLSLSTASGSNNGSVTITALTDNLTGTNRTATLSFDAAGLPSQLVTVTQVDGSVPAFSLSLDTLLLNNPQGSTGTFSVLSNISGWTLTENTPWLLINPTFGNNTASITALAASRNSFGTPRRAVITVNAPGFSTDSVVVIQKEATPLFQVAPNMIVIGSDSGDAMSFNISSNLTTWEVSENATWMEASVSLGSFTQRVMVTATDSNTTGNVRTDTITISAPPLVPQIVSVTQDTIIPIGIKDQSLKQSIGIYPNPSFGIVHIELINGFDINDAQIQVFDMMGKEVLIDLQNISQNKLSLDLRGNATGIYFINLVVGGQRITKKITLLE